MDREPPSFNPYAPPLALGEAARPVAGSTHSGSLAERSTRFWAALIDMLLYVGAAAPGFVTVMGSDHVTTLSVYAFSLPLPLVLACFQWYLIATTGQTLAKRWFRIRIVRLDGSLPGFVHGVLLRSWLLQAFG